MFSFLLLRLPFSPFLDISCFTFLVGLFRSLSGFHVVHVFSLPETEHTRLNISDVMLTHRGATLTACHCSLVKTAESAFFAYVSQTERTKQTSEEAAPV